MNANEIEITITLNFLMNAIEKEIKITLNKIK
jgi:hypothetical protein